MLYIPVCKPIKDTKCNAHIASSYIRELLGHNPYKCNHNCNETTNIHNQLSYIEIGCTNNQSHWDIRHAVISHACTICSYI